MVLLNEMRESCSTFTPASHFSNKQRVIALGGAEGTEHDMFKMPFKTFIKGTTQKNMYYSTVLAISKGCHKLGKRKLKENNIIVDRKSSYDYKCRDHFVHLIKE